MGQSITQSNIFNQIGLAISIVAVLAAGYMSGKLGEKKQSNESERIKEQSRHYLPIETKQIGKPNETVVTSFKALDHASNTLKEVNTLHEVKQQEIPSECLLCPNLTSCNQRGKMTSDSATPCPYSKKINHGKHLS